MVTGTTVGVLPRARRVPLPSPQTLLVLGLCAALVTLTLALGYPVRHEVPQLDRPSLPWWVIAAAFAATEAIVLHIQVRREAQTVSTSELPLVLGLFFASPVGLLVGRLVGSAAVLVLHRRSSPLKTAFNLALVSAETAVSIVVFRLVSGPGAPLPVAWLGAYAGVLVANAVSIVAIGLVIAVYEGGLDARALLREAVVGHPAGIMTVTVALVAVTSLSANVHATWLLLASGAGMLVAYRAYATLSDRHLNLERLYRFSQAVSRAPELDGVLGSVLDEARELLKAERAEVVFVANPGSAVVHVRLVPGSSHLDRSEEAPTPEIDWLLDRVVADGDSLLVPRTSRDPEERAWLEGRGAREALAVPLRGGAGIIGALVVADRQGDVRGFDPDDVRLLETVANHAGVALQNGELIDRLRHEALHDALTGLPNRTFLQRRLASAMQDVSNGRSPGAAVMILDLDGFKEVNDTLGHQKGDLLLAEVATRLLTAIGTAGTVARLGGDEFAVLVADTTDQDRVVGIGRRALRALEHPVDLDGLAIEIGGSLGVALAPAHANDPAVLLKRADLAMYEAKGSSRGLSVYDQRLDDEDPHRLTLVAELRAALQDGTLDVHVQPQARPQDGVVVSVEALVRWTHPRLGPLSPDQFIPVAERSGLIGLLTTRVLDASLAACASWARQGTELAVAVNLSARSLHDADLVEEVDRLLRRHGVPAARLTLEVTEGSVMADPAHAIAVLQRLRDLGVRLSVDDFGTGYSSLSYLKRLPIDEVKIDKTFVTGLASGGEDAAIVRTIVDLAQHLRLEVVAEGVEDEATWDQLASLGCHLVQGWHLSRAMPVADLLPWLDARTPAPGRRPQGR